MSVSYEWDVELVETYEDGDNDVHDHMHQASYADCLKQAAQPLEDRHQWEIVLVCDDDNGRSWAYVKEGKLPEYFEDAYGGEPRKVPQRFHKEVQEAR